MDDDIAVDIFQILKKLKETDQIESCEPLPKPGYQCRDGIYGLLQLKMEVKRNKTSKWFVTRDEYPQKLYEPFFSGWAYVTTPKVVKSLIKASGKIPYFWIDDVYITGTLAKQVGVQQVKWNRVFTIYTEFIKCCYELKDFTGNLCEFMVGPTLGKTGVMREFLKHTKTCHDQKCNKTSEEHKMQPECLKQYQRTKISPPGKGTVVRLKLK